MKCQKKTIDYLSPTIESIGICVSEVICESGFTEGYGKGEDYPGDIWGVIVE